jgi:multicomponent Na+:H+ antiporter subunit D
MLLLFIVLPLAVAALMPLLHRLNRWLPDALAALTMLGTLLLGIAHIRLIGAGHIYYWDSALYGLPIRLSLMMDGFSLLLLLTISMVSFFACVFSVNYMEHYGGKGAYYALFLIMVAGMNGLVLTTDLFSLYVFLEVAAIASYALVAFGQKHDEVEAAFKYLMLSAVATTGILLATALVYLMTGTLGFAELAAAARAGFDPRLLGLLLAFFLMGFGLKAAIVPFHAWLPDAHPSAPAPISAMLSGVVIKVSGIYALVRVVYNVFGLPVGVSQALLALGALSMVLGALIALGQTDFKRMLAYSSISQVGYIVIGLALGTPLAIMGALFHLFNHATFKGLLFLDAGATEYATGTRELSKLGGINNRLPITGLTTTIGTFSIAGVPPFNGFWSKLLIIVALVQAGQLGLAALAVGTSVLTLWYFLLIQRRAFFGKLAAGMEKIKEVPFYMSFATVGLAVLCLAVGLCYPWVADNLIQPGMTSLTNAIGVNGFSLFGN